MLLSSSNSGGFRKDIPGRGNRKYKGKVQRHDTGECFAVVGGHCAGKAEEQ